MQAHGERVNAVTAIWILASSVNHCAIVLPQKTFTSIFMSDCRGHGIEWRANLPRIIHVHHATMLTIFYLMSIRTTGRYSPFSPAGKKKKATKNKNEPHRTKCNLNQK